MIGRASSFTIASVVAGFASASHCMIGWPAIVGSSTKDGNTEVTVWAETPFPDTYLIGGHSESEDFTEDSLCSENEHGCAYLTNWNKVSQEFEQKWIFTDVFNVIDIMFSPDQSVFAVAFMKWDQWDESYKNVLTFHEWASGGKTAQINSTAYTINEPLDIEVYDTFGHLSLFQDNRFHLISNNPSKL